MTYLGRLRVALRHPGALWILSALAVSACSSAPEATSPTGADGGSETTTAPPSVEAGPSESRAMPEAPSGPEPSDDGRELTPSDCNALAARYGFTVRSDEMAKLHPDLTSAQRDQARAAIDRAAEQLETGWRNGCLQSLTGKVASETAVRCALAAKTVAAFDGCLNAPPGATP